MAEKESSVKVVATNRRARHEYSIEETYEAGIVLTGTEIQSVRQGRVSLADAYAEVRNGEVFMVNAHIAEYDFGNRFNHDPRRPRKLLLNKKEIRRLDSRVREQGYTIVPLRMYIVRGYAKVEIGLRRGRSSGISAGTLQNARPGAKWKGRPRGGISGTAGIWRSHPARSYMRTCTRLLHLINTRIEWYNNV